MRPSWNRAVVELRPARTPLGPKGASNTASRSAKSHSGLRPFGISLLMPAKGALRVLNDLNCVIGKRGDERCAMAEESVAAYAAQFGDPFPRLMLWEGTDEDLVTLLQQCLKEGPR